jgi:hypothetical protein
MLGIYTRSTSYFSKEYWKWAARRLTDKYSGPNAVEDSLLRGLKELDIPFEHNSYNSDLDTALILSGAQALSEAIARKKSGVIKKLVAGPNIVIHPLDLDRIILDESIDIVLVPSEWVADFWSHENPELSSKIRTWPAGVSVSPASTRAGQPIIYDKLGDEDLVTKVEASIGSSARKFTYGQFSREKYLESLTEAPFLVYLSKSESQGLALQEAWAHDVPTIVNNSTHWEAGELSWDAPQINCPYLTPELGAVFTNPAEIPIIAKRLVAINPKKYCDEHLSDEASTKCLLKLIS